MKSDVRDDREHLKQSWVGHTDKLQDKVQWQQVKYIDVPEGVEVSKQVAAVRAKVSQKDEAGRAPVSKFSLAKR